MQHFSFEIPALPNPLTFFPMKQPNLAVSLWPATGRAGGAREGDGVAGVHALRVAVRLAAYAAPFLNCTTIEVECNYAPNRTPNQWSSCYFILQSALSPTSAYLEGGAFGQCQMVRPDRNYRTTRPEIA